MKLIREEIETVEFVTEEKNGKKSLYIEGVFLQGNIKNRNGRMYPMETLAKEVNRYNESNVVTGRALGELGHPDGPTVNLDRVSHKIVSLKEDMHGCKVVGEDFQLATAADIVADPSAPDAFVNGIMEGKEWVWEGGILREQLAEKTEKRINTLVTQKRLEEKKLSLFQDFLNNL